MLKIFYATLHPTSTTDADGDICEWQWVEKNKAEYGAEWGGDVRGYVENLLDDGDEIGQATVHNCPPGALIVLHGGTPSELYWAEDCEDLISIPEYATKE